MFDLCRKMHMYTVNLVILAVDYFLAILWVNQVHKTEILTNTNNMHALIESVTCVWLISIYLSRGWSAVKNPSRGFNRD